ncbi:hypothetical protein GQX74_001182 [Glossina fuscipes]|nr:hypothetical protein GQX74_001182 [Glossina fuscipes]
MTRSNISRTSVKTCFCTLLAFSQINWNKWPLIMCSQASKEQEGDSESNAWIRILILFITLLFSLCVFVKHSHAFNYQLLLVTLCVHFIYAWKEIPTFKVADLQTKREENENDNELTTTKW